MHRTSNPIMPTQMQKLQHQAPLQGACPPALSTMRRGPTKAPRTPEKSPSHQGLPPARQEGPQNGGCHLQKPQNGSCVHKRQQCRPKKWPMRTPTTLLGSPASPLRLYRQASKSGLLTGEYGAASAPPPAWLQPAQPASQGQPASCACDLDEERSTIERSTPSGSKNGQVALTDGHLFDHSEPAQPHEGLQASCRQAAPKAQL